MRIGFVCKGALRAFLKTYERGECESAEGEKKTDIFLFGFNGLREVSYEKELKGETKHFEDVARLSKAAKSVVVCGCTTDTRGHKRRSAVVAENGRLLGVSDMLNAVDGEVGSGASLRVYETKAGRMGVAVAEDLYFPEVVRSLAMCGSDFIVCPFGVSESIQPVLARASAYFYGIPVLFCADGYATVAQSSGEVAFASPQSPVFADLELTKEYHLVETRRRGAYRDSIRKGETADGGADRAK